MMPHHDKHHASYVKNLNATLVQFPGLQERTALWLLPNLNEVTEGARAVLRNNAGGHVNQSLFWHTRNVAGSEAVSGPLLDAIHLDFRSFDKFKVRFQDAGSSVFGFGWVWLARAQPDGGKLHIYITAGHERR